MTFLRHARADIDHVGIRDADAAAAATAHLVELGHRKIAYLGGSNKSTVRQNRIAGYERVLTRHGLGPGLVWPSQDSKLAGMDAVIALRSAHPDVTGIVCNGDMVALGSCLGLIRIGLAPGKDMSVVGFDDVEDAAVATPPLTTMSVQPHLLGRKLGKALLDRIHHPDHPAVFTEVAADLVVRQTTAALGSPDIQAL